MKGQGGPGVPRASHAEGRALGKLGIISKKKQGAPAAGLAPGDPLGPPRPCPEGVQPLTKDEKDGRRIRRILHPNTKLSTSSHAPRSASASIILATPRRYGSSMGTARRCACALSAPPVRLALPGRRARRRSPCACAPFRACAPLCACARPRCWSISTCFN
jgi:hypothetical protein